MHRSMLRALILKTDEDTANAFAEMLYDNNYEFDVDFTAIYEAGGQLVGLRVFGEDAVALVERAWHAYTIGQLES